VHKVFDKIDTNCNSYDYEILSIKREYANSKFVIECQDKTSFVNVWNLKAFVMSWLLEIQIKNAT
jgi:hypothetical protein